MSCDQRYTDFLYLSTCGTAREVEALPGTASLKAKTRTFGTAADELEQIRDPPSRENVLRRTLSELAAQFCMLQRQVLNVPADRRYCHYEKHQRSLKG